MIILWIVNFVVIWLTLTTLIDFRLMGYPTIRFSRKKYPPKYMITKKNQVDIQQNFECSGYSAAYLMRHFDIQAKGEDMYKIMPNKMRNGYVYPKGIVKLLELQGLEATFRIGSIAALKGEISKGTPVIVLMKVFENKSYLHYVSVIGYDEENLYIAESLKELINANDLNYNRKIAISEFKKLWKTNDVRMPLFRYSYFTVCRSEEDMQK